MPCRNAGTGSQARFEGSHVPALIPVSDVGSPGLDTHGGRGQDETVRTGLPDDEVEVVS